MNFNSENQDTIESDQNCETESEEDIETRSTFGYSDHEKMEILVKPTTSQATSGQMRISLSKLLKIYYRYGATDRGGAVIATAILEDFGIVTKDDVSNVVDQYKLRREAGSRINSLSVQRNGILRKIHNLL